MVKLTPEIVREIRARYQTFFQLRRRRDASTGAELAREFGVSGACISMIVRRRRWKHVK
jgi:hypothetical protein